MKNRIKVRRAIADIVSNAIILSAVSIMGVMMLAWANTSMLQQQMEIESIFNSQMNKINEDLIFENIWFGTTPNHLNVTMTNSGILGLNVTEIHVTNVTANNNEKFIYYFTNGGMPKSTSFSTIDTSYDWDPKDELEILVLTERGNQFNTQVVAP